VLSSGRLASTNSCKPADCTPANRFPHARCDSATLGGAFRGCPGPPTAAAPHLPFSLAISRPHCDETIGYLGHICLTGRGRMTAYAEPASNRPYAERASTLSPAASTRRASRAFVRGQFEAEMSRGGFECAERVEWWKGVGPSPALTLMAGPA